MLLSNGTPRPTQLRWGQGARAGQDISSTFPHGAQSKPRWEGQECWVHPFCHPPLLTLG